MTRTELIRQITDLASVALDNSQTIGAAGILLALATAMVAGTEEALLHAVVPSMVELQRKAEQDKAQNN